MPNPLRQRARQIGLVVLLAALSVRLSAQATPSPQQLVFAGLRSIAQQGQIDAIQCDASGNLYLLLDQKDGVRLLKTDNAGTNILAQTQLGSSGDIGVGLALDQSGNLYVAGTTTSGRITATSGTALPTPTGNSTHSFVAKFDSNLNPLFVTFTGGNRIAVSAIAANASAVFVTGITYSTDLPVTSNAIQQSPALGSVQNGFVEKFSANGATLLYATYLTGALGDTTPTAIAADTAGDVWIAGSTSASGFPTVAALVPDILSNPSGFLTRLTSAGDAITASTFIPGPGLTSLALDSAGQTLLASGSVALGQFPVDTVTVAVIPTTYQVLLRLPLDLSAVQSSTLIAPGTQSFVAAAPSGAAWLDGPLTLPLLPIPTLSGIGDAFAIRVTSSGTPDETARIGGLPSENPAYASLPSVIASIAVDSFGEPLIAGAVQPTASSSLLATQTYDLPLRNNPTPALPSALSDAELSAITCTGSLCAGSAAYLAKLNPTAASALAFSANDLPFVILRNLGSAPAQNLQFTAPGATLSTNCPATLPAGGICNLMLSGSGTTTLSASTSTSDTQTLTIPSIPAATSTIAFYPRELDFGIQTSTNPPATRTLTITNLGSSSQTFTSSLDAIVTSRTTSTSPFTESSSDCTNTGQITSKTLAPGATCHITLALNASSSASSDGILQANWLIGSRDALLTGYSQAASLSLSASEIDFGTQFSKGIHLPRFLYLSNASTSTLAHTALTTQPNSPFTLTDSCPAALLPSTVCRIRIDYLASTAPSTDSTTLTLDQGLTVLLTAKTLPPPSVTGATVNPNLSVTPTAVTFATAVPVTAVSTTTQTVAITNTGASPFALTLALTGDFLQTSSCGATLAGGATCAVALTFAPTAPGARQGLLSITAGPGTTPAYVTLNATASAILPANNGTLDFGTSPIGQPVVQFYKVAQPFHSLSMTTTGPYTAALIEDTGYGHGQPPTSAFTSSVAGTCFNCFLAIQFLPTAAGPQPGTLTLTSSPQGSPYTLALAGAGVSLSGLVLTPLTYDFGSAPIHSVSGSALFTVTNLDPSNASATLSIPQLGGDFILLNSTCPATLAYTASCALTVAFQPTASAVRTGSLSIASQTQSAAASLTGLGAADPGITIDPLALDFQNLPGTAATRQTVTLTNSSAAAIHIGTPSTATASFVAASQCAQLLSTQSCAITVTFIPANAAASDTLSIPVITDSQTTTYNVALSGTYTASTAGLAIFPTLAEYGPSPVLIETPARQFTITNLTAKTLALSIDIPRQFILTGVPCTSLLPSASCSFSLAFLPLTNGGIPGTINAQATPSDGSAPLSGIAYVEGYGEGAGTLTLSGGLIVDGVFNFGQVTSGQSATQTFTLTDSAASAVTVRRITSPPPFLASSTCGPLLAAGQSCAITVTYTPANQVASGTASPSSTTDTGTLTIESDAASSPTILNLSGLAGPLSASSPANSTALATFTLSQNALTFPLTQVGNATPSQSVTFTNTGTVPLHVFSLLIPTDFKAQTTCASVIPGATCTLTVISTPTTTGTHIGALEISSDAATPLEFVSLISTASAATLSLSPAALLFGPIPINTASTLPIQITNTGTAAVTFNALLLTGDYAASNGSCPLSGGLLAPSATCTLQVTFTPTSNGPRSGTLSIATSSSVYPLVVPLSGTGTQSQLIVTPSSLSFGSIAVGSTSTLSLTLRNTGTAAVTNLALTISGDYAFTQTCAGTLAAAATCTVQISFSPTALGSRTGVLTLISSDPGSPAAIPLTGTGIQGGGFTLTVDGGATSSITVASGHPASYNLLLTPTGGFTGDVAFTCTPVTAAPYATCSLLPASLAVTGTGALPAAVAINTITSTGGSAARLTSLTHPLLCLLLPGLWLLWRDRQSLRRSRPFLLALLFAALAITFSGCSGGKDPNLLYTPVGTYRYQVTASSTTGVQVTQTVTLNLIVTAN